MKTTKPKSLPRPGKSNARPAAADSKSHKPQPEIVLLAVTGMSPAVLTETVWALAQENPPVIPHRVVVITTLAGKGRFEDELFTPSPDPSTTSRLYIPGWAMIRRDDVDHGPRGQ